MRGRAGIGQGRPLPVEAKMSEFVVAIGLVLAIEGLVFAAFPQAAKRLAANVLETPEGALRIAGVVSAVFGVVLIWLVRG
jgi:uncharacterized protein YjeT (DUF2065 family)